jgi:short-subunit dehydrogenase
MGVNFWGLIHIINSFLPSLIERRQGHFVNIASANGLAPLPFVGAYSASKSAVLMISETLRYEVARYGVGVTTVCPGLTRSEMRNDVRFRTDARGTREFLENLIRRARNREIDPFIVANKILAAIHGNRAFIRISAETFLLSWLYRFFPRLLRLGARSVVKKIT